MPDASAVPEIQRVNRVLMVVAILSLGWSMYGTVRNMQRYWELQMSMGGRIGSPSPVPPYERYAAVFLLLATLGGTCLYRTRRAPDRPATVYLNVAGIVVPLLWWIFHTTAFYISVSSLLSELRGP